MKDIKNLRRKEHAKAYKLLSLLLFHSFTKNKKSFIFYS
ncbi:unnamed protein product [Brassica rapa subsp. narinosa]